MAINIAHLKKEGYAIAIDDVTHSKRTKSYNFFFKYMLVEFA